MSECPYCIDKFETDELAYWHFKLKHIALIEAGFWKDSVSKLWKKEVNHD